MSEEKKDAVIQRGTPREREDVSKNPEWLKARVEHLEGKKKALSDRTALVDQELAERKEQLANLEGGE